MEAVLELYMVSVRGVGGEREDVIRLKKEVDVKAVHGNWEGEEQRAWY